MRGLMYEADEDLDDSAVDEEEEEEDLSEEVSSLLCEVDAAAEEKIDSGALRRRFITPPFTVLDTRSGDWRTRKRAWTGLLRGGTQGATTGRAKSLTYNVGKTRPDYFKKKIGGFDDTGTSIFDPVLTECLVEWFCPRGGHVLDPFAGDGTRGIVSALLGRRYTGVDLRAEQVAYNEAQLVRVRAAVGAVGGGGAGGGGHMDGAATWAPPVWHCGDSTVVLCRHGTDGPHGARALPLRGAADAADMVLTCPPYGDLEVYSDDPADLSLVAQRDHQKFLDAYAEILASATARLRPDRFVAIVVGNYRDRRGHCRDFVGETVVAARAAGLSLYNEAVLINAIGTLPLRAGMQMRASRKLGRCHQNVLVFVKGDWRRAAAACAAGAPAEMGYQDLPCAEAGEPPPAAAAHAAPATLLAVGVLQGGDAALDGGVGIAPQLPQEAGVGVGGLGVQDGVPEAA